MDRKPIEIFKFLDTNFRRSNEYNFIEYIGTTNR